MCCIVPNSAASRGSMQKVYSLEWPAVYIDNLKTLREGAGIRKTALATAAGVSRDTVTRVEKHHRSTKETCVSIIHALNKLHYSSNGRPLDPEVEISGVSRHGVCA